MSIGVTEEHAALTEAVRGWALRHAPITAAVAAKDRPPFWDSLAEQGLLGMHLAEAHGGAGATHVELAVAIEALGYRLVGGPFLSTVTATTLLQIAGAGELAEPLAAAASAAAIGLDGGLVLSGAEADVYLVKQGAHWVVADAAAVSVNPLSTLDPTRSLTRVEVIGHPRHQLPELDDEVVRDVSVTLASAEAAGIAAWCLDTAVDYAKVREQFGRPIGQFQAIKHLCADMLVHVEQAQAVAWDAARATADAEQRTLASAVAASVALEAAVSCAKSCIQILGGIGFTWEHDAHRYLRRALTLRQLFGPTARWRAAAAVSALEGRRRTLGIDLDADGVRAEVRTFVATLSDLDDRARRHRLADEGYLAPHWPQPHGRAADAVEQLVIDEELRAAGIKRPDLVIAAWILPTIIAHGTEDQQRRFVPGTLRGETTWCQLFSEPGAGSDLAALQAKATRSDGGWLLNGQKVWSSLAHRTDYGLCLARTDPAAPKHDGITCFVVDMNSEGLDIRPLRELTGREMFNEVFFNDVFVPDDCVIGKVNDGWRAGRTTLSNERVAMASGSTMGAGVEGVLRAVAGAGDPDAGLLQRLGALVAEGQVLALLGLRTTLRQLSGTDPGAASSVRKLVGMHHAQSCAELALELLGPAGATTEGPAEAVTFGFLQSRCLTIAGGTTQVQRNVIAERLLGLPRDP